MNVRIFVLSSLVLAGCGELSSPSALDHAQILAVRASPPRVMPNERSRIDLLAGLDDGTVAVLVPSVEGGLAVHEPDATYVVAPPAAGEPFGLPIEVSVELQGAIKRAEKTLFVGAAGANPTIDGILLDGEPIQEEPVVVAAGTRPRFSVTAAGEAELAFAWHSSVGDLGFYRSETMELHADAAADGLLVAVVRDAVGGTEWRVLEISVR